MPDHKRNNLIERICRECGKSFLCRPTLASDEKRKGIYCSMECLNKAHGKMLKGKPMPPHIRAIAIKSGLWKPFLTEKQEAEICIKYKNGKTINGLSREYKCSSPTIRKAITKQNIPIRKGGVIKKHKIKDGNGYVLIYAPNHHRANKKGYSYEHIIEAEKKYNKILLKGSIVHHVNGIKDDNSQDNLITCTKREHSFLHQGSISKILEWAKANGCPYSNVINGGFL